jgi:hypothetical protein
MTVVYNKDAELVENVLKDTDGKYPRCLLFIIKMESWWKISQMTVVYNKDGKLVENIPDDCCL